MKLSISLLFTLLSSCGYNWGHADRSLPGGHKTVFVQMFSNSTKEAGIEDDFTHALNKEFERSGFLTVSDKNTAEVIISGEIIEFVNVGSGSVPRFYQADHVNQKSEAYSASMFTNFDVKIATNLKATRSRDQKIIWQTNLVGQKVYFGSQLTKQGLRSSNVLYNQARKKQTVKLIAKDMMNEAFDRLTENF